MPYIVRAVAVAAFLSLSAAAPAAASDFTVNTRDDGPVGGCTADHCTLREALTDANNQPGADFIRFRISTPAVIALRGDALPPVVDQVEIEGENGQPSGRPGVTIDGAAVISQPVAFDVRADGTTIRNLAIVNFGGSAVILDASNAIVTGNYIGTDALTGLADLGNKGGVTVGGTGNFVARNVISGNDSGGVDLGGTANVVQNNCIGLNAGCRVPLTHPLGEASMGDGLEASRGDGVRVRGERHFVEGNTIAAMGQGGEGGGSGVHLKGSNHTVRSNRIGTNKPAWDEQETAYGNEVGGVWVEGSGHVIADNLISGNKIRGGVWLQGSRSVTVERNRIGTTGDGRGALGNGEFGIATSYASTNRIADNLIAYNDGPGVVVGYSWFGPTYAFGGLGNTVTANKVFDNDGLGIDLILPYGPNTNDPGDVDTGANGLQNHPKLGTARATKHGVVVEGLLASAAAASYRVEFFAAPSCDGDARAYLGETTVETDRTGRARIRTRLAAQPAGTAITATATDAAGSTSELSDCVTVQ